MSGDSFQIRRLYAAPDDASQVLATCDRGAVPVLHVTKGSSSEPSRVQLVPDTDDTPQATLPFPATDIAWCPFKSGADNASFLTSCRSQPLQLWDVADGSVRAAYVALNDSGMNAHPRAVLWLPSPFQNLIAGAYGGVEDATQVRVFDVAVEGDQCVFGYRSPCTKGPISALGQCAPLPSNSTPPANTLLLAGYLHHNQVDCIDYRHHCAAAILRGPAQGGSSSVSCIRTTPHAPHLVFAAGRGGTGSQGDIVCWDLRKPGAILAQFTRPVHTQQQCDFALVAENGGSGVRLVSATTAGGLLVFENVAACAERVQGTPTHTHAGITSGLAPLNNSEVVVAVGAREYRFTVSEGGAQRGRAVPPVREDAGAEGGSCRTLSETEDEASDAFFSAIRAKRTRALAALSESDDEPAGNVSSVMPELNVRVLTI